MTPEALFQLIRTVKPSQVLSTLRGIEKLYPIVYKAVMAFYIDAAKQVIENTRPKCEACEGTGVVKGRTDEEPSQYTCNECNGTGFQ